MTDISRRKATIDAPYMPFAFIYDNDGNPIKVSATQLGTTAAEQAQFKDLLTTRHSHKQSEDTVCKSVGHARRRQVH